MHFNRSTEMIDSFWGIKAVISRKIKRNNMAKNVCKACPILKKFCNQRIYSTYRVVTTSRLKAPRRLVVHDNLKSFTKYSKRSVHNLQGLQQLSVLYALGHLYNLRLSYTNCSIGDQRHRQSGICILCNLCIGSEESVYYIIYGQAVRDLYTIYLWLASEGPVYYIIYG